MFAVTRYASLSSILGAASLAPLAYGLGYPWPVIAFGGAARPFAPPKTPAAAM